MDILDETLEGAHDVFDNILFIGFLDLIDDFVLFVVTVVFEVFIDSIFILAIVIVFIA